MNINYPNDFVSKVGELLGESSKAYLYAKEGNLKLGAILSDSLSNLNQQSCFIEFSNKTKEEINNYINENKKLVQIDSLYDCWIEIVEKEYDERESRSTTVRERV